MKVKHIMLEVLELGAVPGFAVQIHVVGSGFFDRAAPLLARFGAQPVQNLFIVPGGAGFSGYLAEPPAAEDRLFVKYVDEPEIEIREEEDVEPPLIV